MAKTHIRISFELKRFLEEQSFRKGETYDLIIRRLIEEGWKVKIPPEIDENSTSKIEAK